MADPDLTHELLLQMIGRATPEAWYPAALLQSKQLDQSRLDRILDDLRMSGMVELTPWQPGLGQGLRLTPEGRRVLGSPKVQIRLRDQAGTTLHRSGPMPSRDDESTTYGRGEAIRRALMSPTPPRVTQILIAVNILIFLIGQVIALRGQNAGFIQFGEERALRLTGAVSGQYLLQGQWWRLLTCCFVHIGAMHLFMNMYSLWVLGPIQERIWGRTRFLCIYLVAAFAGSCAGMALRPASILAGASGGTWGLMAALLVWVYLNRAHLPRQLVADRTNQLVTAVILNAVISFMPGISAEGHFAGGAAGALTAALLHGHRFGTGVMRWVCLAVVGLVPMVSLGAVVLAKERTRDWHRVIRYYGEDGRRVMPDEAPDD